MCFSAHLTFLSGPSSGCTSRHNSSGMVYTALMSDEKKPPTQKTRQGTEIPVPRRKDSLRDLRKTARTKPMPSTSGGRPKK